MGIVFRQSAKTSLVVIMGAALGALVIWLSTNFIPDKHQFGFTQDLTNRAVALSQVLIFGLNSTLGVYIHRYANDDRKRKLLIATCLILPFIFTILICVPYFLLRPWIIGHFQPADIPFWQRYFMWLPVYCLFFIYQAMLETYLGSQMKVALAAFIREVVLRLLFITLIVLFGFQYISFHTLVTGMVLIYMLPVSVFYFLSLKTKGFGLSLRLRSFSIAEYKELIHFSWYHLLLSITFMLMSYMDMLLIPFYDHGGYGSLAVYRVAIFLVVLITLPSKALIPASFTVLARAFADKDMAKAKDLFIRSSINILIPTIGISILIVCNLQNAVDVIKNGYSQIIPLFLILFIGNFVNQATGMNDQVLSIANYYKFNFYLALVIVVFFFVMIRTFVPRYGLYGAAWSTTSIIMVFNIAKCIFVWKKLGMLPFSYRSILVAIAALPALAAGYFFPHFFNPAHHVYTHTFIDVALRSTVIIVTYALMLLWLKPSPDLEEYVIQIKKNKRLF